MSTFKQKKELSSTISRMKAANKEKKGSFSPQQIGRVQYKLNQLAADPKGNAVRSKPKGKQKVGSVIKTGTGGIVRQKPKANLPKKKRIISKGIVDPKKTGGHPSARPTVKKKPTTTKKNGGGLSIEFLPNNVKPRTYVPRRQTGHPSANKTLEKVGHAYGLAVTGRPKFHTTKEIKQMTTTQLKRLAASGSPEMARQAKKVLKTKK